MLALMREAELLHQRARKAVRPVAGETERRRLGQARCPQSSQKRSRHAVNEKSVGAIYRSQHAAFLGNTDELQSHGSARRKIQHPGLCPDSAKREVLSLTAGLADSTRRLDDAASWSAHCRRQT